MIEHIWTIPCRLSTTDRESNNVSLIEVLEEVTVPGVAPPPGLALVPAYFDVVTLWARGGDDRPAAGTGRMSLVGPDGEQLFAQEYAIDLRDVRRVRCVGRVLGLPARQSGRYQFRIERRVGEADGWEIAASVPLWVNTLRQENTAGSAAAG